MHAFTSSLFDTWVDMTKKLAQQIAESNRLWSKNGASILQ